MYTSVDLSALHEKKRFTEKTESHIFRPHGWLLLLAGCYLIGIFLGCRVLRLAPDELLHGMKAVFRTPGHSHRTNAAAAGDFIILASHDPTFDVVSPGVLCFGTTGFPNHDGI